MVVRLILAEFHNVIIDSSNVLYRLLDFAFATYICASTGSTVNVVNIQLISTMSSASVIIVELVTNEERRVIAKDTIRYFYIGIIHNRDSCYD